VEKGAVIIEHYEIKLCIKNNQLTITAIRVSSTLLAMLQYILVYHQPLSNNYRHRCMQNFSRRVSTKVGIYQCKLQEARKWSGYSEMSVSFLGVCPPKKF